LPECEALADLVAASARSVAEARAQCVDISIDHNLDCRSVVRLAEAVERRTGWAILPQFGSFAASKTIVRPRNSNADRYFRSLLSLKRNEH